MPTDRLAAAARRVLAATREHRGLLIVVALACLPRGLATWALRPAILAHADSFYYFERAYGRHLFDGSTLAPRELRPPLYAYYLEGFGHLWRDLTAIITVQHLLGVLAVACVYLTMRQLGVNAKLAVVAGGLIALDGKLAVLEHYALSEALFWPAVSVFAYAIVRASRTGSGPWAVAAAFAAAFATLARPTGVVLVLVGALLLAARARKRPWQAVAFICVAAIVLAAAATERPQRDGRFNTGSSSGLFLYGRVIPLADCANLTVEEQKLCDPRPVEERPGPAYYLWDNPSPLRATNTNELDPVLGRIAKKVILAQPVDYASSVLRDFARFWIGGRMGGGRPGWQVEPIDVPSTDYGLVNRGIGPVVFERYKGMFPGDTPQRAAGYDTLRAWQRWAHVPVQVLAWGALLALAALALPSAAMRLERLALIAAGVGMVLVSCMTSLYGYRYSIASLPLLAPPIVLAAQDVWRRVRA